MPTYFISIEKYKYRLMSEHLHFHTHLKKRTIVHIFENLINKSIFWNVS